MILDIISRLFSYKLSLRKSTANTSGKAIMPQRTSFLRIINS